MTCPWCEGRKEIGPASDSYVCVRCNGTGDVAKQKQGDVAFRMGIEDNKPQWEIEDAKRGMISPWMDETTITRSRATIDS